MKSWKLSLVVALAIVISGLAFTQAHAQQSDNGSTVVNTYGHSGDGANGGVNQTGGTVTYQTPVTTNPTASGNAEADGAGMSNNYAMPAIPRVSTSSSSFSFAVGATGPQSTITVNGFAGQENWATAPSPSTGNYADGGDGAGATVAGSTSGDNITGDGGATAKGKTDAISTVSPNGLTATSAASTKASSNASGLLSGATPQLSTGANGAGGVEAGSMVTGPNGSGAESNFAGNVQYSSANPSGSSTGSLKATGLNTATVSTSGNAASASSKVSTQAQAH